MCNYFSIPTYNVAHHPPPVASASQPIDSAAVGVHGRCYAAIFINVL